jgi:hypothetical protein
MTSWTSSCVRPSTRTEKPDFRIYHNNLPGWTSYRPGTPLQDLVDDGLGKVRLLRALKRGELEVFPHGSDAMAVINALDWVDQERSQGT